MVTVKVVVVVQMQMMLDMKNDWVGKLIKKAYLEAQAKITLQNEIKTTTTKSKHF